MQFAILGQWNRKPSSSCSFNLVITGHSPKESQCRQKACQTLPESFESAARGLLRFCVSESAISRDIWNDPLSWRYKDLIKSGSMNEKLLKSTRRILKHLDTIRLLSSIIHGQKSHGKLPHDPRARRTVRGAGSTEMLVPKRSVWSFVGALTNAAG